MRLLDVPPEGAIVASGGCYLCGSTQRSGPDGTPSEGVVDFERIIEFEGHLMFCQSCGEEVGRICGLISPDELEMLKTSLEGITAERDDLAAKLEERERLEGLLSESLDEVRGHEEPAEVQA